MVLDQSFHLDQLGLPKRRTIHIMLLWIFLSISFFKYVYTKGPVASEVGKQIRKADSMTRASNCRVKLLNEIVRRLRQVNTR